MSIQFISPKTDWIWLAPQDLSHKMEPLGIGCVKSLPEKIKKIYVKTILVKIN